MNTGGKKNGGGVGEFLESWSPLVSKLVSYLFMKRSGERRIPEMRDGKKIFRRMRRIVMEIRYTSVRGFLAQFKRLSPPCPVARAISLSLSLESPCPFFFVFASFVKNNFISPLFFFFCLPVGIVEFISLRSSESATGTGRGGEETGGKLSIFRLEERDRRCSVNIEKTKSLVLYRKFYWNPKIVGIKLGAYASGVFIFRIKIHVWAGSVQFCLIRGGIIIPRGVLIV